MEDLETFEDVVKYAEELGSYCKSEMKSKGIDQLQVGDMMKIQKNMIQTK